MLLIYVKKLTPRISYTFKHICKRILGIDIEFTSVLETFLAHQGPKISYGRKALGSEVFFQANGLLEQQGIENADVVVKPWGHTVGLFPTSASSSLPFDIFSGTFYLLSRYEEYLPHVKDELGRFLAPESLAYKENFLHQPVVDIWALKFKNVLINFFPELTLEFNLRKFKIHALIDASQPYAFAQKGFFRTMIGYFSDILSFNWKNLISRSQVVLGFKKDPLDTFKWIINTSGHNDYELTVFFLLGESLTFQNSMNHHRRKLISLIKYIADYKEVGLVFSYKNLFNPLALKSEKEHMERITYRPLKSFMNAELVVHLPEIYRQLVELEVKKDFTMVFSDTPGFRAGTCTPFLFYDLDFEIKTPLLIHPVVAHTNMFDAKYSSNKSRLVEQFLNETAQVGGNFTMIFSNKDFSSEEQNLVWRKLFSEKFSLFQNTINSQ